MWDLPLMVTMEVMVPFSTNHIMGWFPLGIGCPESISITMEEAAQRFQPGMGQPAIFSTDRRAMCSQRVPTRWVALVMIRS